MKRTRIERKDRPIREERTPVLPLDPRDPDVARAKQRSRPTLRDRL
ncbi:MAG TPA: hypothetical protein VGA30_06130 [Actinomycetota bacterium]